MPQAGPLSACVLTTTAPLPMWEGAFLRRRIISAPVPASAAGCDHVPSDC